MLALQVLLIIKMAENLQTKILIKSILIDLANRKDKKEFNLVDSAIHSFLQLSTP
jgi:hypothetical protein